MNSFCYDTEVMNSMYLRCTPDQQPELKLELKGSKTGRLSAKEENICQAIYTNQQHLFNITELSKSRKRKTAIYTTKETAPGFNLTCNINNDGSGFTGVDSSHASRWIY